MFNRIMVPVDLAHVDKLTRSLTVAGDMASHYGASLCFVAVGSSAPGPTGRTPAEFGDTLAAFADAQGRQRGVSATSLPILAHDPAADLNHALLKAVKDTGADLVIMASHVPGIADYLLSSHGGHLAAHAGVSVMLIREG
ncbi:universal stress protein [Chachezhania sediminis]|uniref:universal stress protein n=1 Tax=Chachezhania sediminis TaxID=2599291 RepID=UPI00131C00C7|nr:universal stress protein [Chachezhania sediminis]